MELAMTIWMFANNFELIRLAFCNHRHNSERPDYSGIEYNHFSAANFANKVRRMVISLPDETFE